MSCERVCILFIMMFQLVVMYFLFDSNINFGRGTILLSEFFFVIVKKLLIQHIESRTNIDEEYFPTYNVCSLLFRTVHT